MNNSKEVSVVDQMTKDNKGKYLICRTDEKSKTRHFICRVGALANEETRDGWWDTFTISKEECEPGYGIFKVKHFTTDKNDNVILIVTPVCHLKDFSYRDLKSNGWVAILRSKGFCGGYYHTYDGFWDTYELNIGALRGLLQTKGKDPDNMSELYAQTLELFVEGTLSFAEVKDAVNEPSDFEKLMEQIRFQTVANEGPLWESHPMFMDRMRALWDNLEFRSDNISRRIEILVDKARSDSKYAESGFPEHVSIQSNPSLCLDVAEWMCKRYAEQREAVKLAKKEARKAKKVS